MGKIKKLLLSIVLIVSMVSPALAWDPPGQWDSFIQALNSGNYAAKFSLLTIPHRTAPASPVNGDMWTTTLGLYARINGVTVGPFTATGGIGTFSSLIVTGLTGGYLPYIAPTTKLMTDSIVSQPFSTAMNIGGSLISVGPAAVTTFVGTISRSGTTLTFSSAQDAANAGWNASVPLRVVGTTVIHPTGPVTMVIMAWLSNVTCTVDSTGTLAAQTPTSTQFPIRANKTSAGVLAEAVLASGNYYLAGSSGHGTTNPTWLSTLYKDTNSGSAGIYPAFMINNPNAAGYLAYLFFNGSTQVGGLEANTATGNITIFTGATKNLLLNSGGGNVVLGAAAVGTSSNKVWGHASGTAPSSAPADMSQLWVIDLNGAGTAGFRFMNEAATTVYTLTGVSASTPVSTGVGSVLMASATVGPTPNTGWLTVLNNLGQPVAVPYWATALP